MNSSERFDVVMVGSGFTGSILGQILVKRGLKAAIVDPVTHPRFAIGESSTPLADGILRRLGETYDLPRLIDMSAWGSWQAKQRHLVAGKKRGFSYFQHQSGHAFEEASLGQSSLLIAASPADECSDTHWLRSDVDAQWMNDYRNLGGHDATGYRVVACEGHQLVCQSVSSPNRIRTFVSDWIVDASGGSGAMARLCESEDWTSRMKTRTCGRYAHFDGVASWADVDGQDPSDRQWPFHADDAAQHHLLGDEGWMWMLRFAGGRTSVGWVEPIDQSPGSFARNGRDLTDEDVCSDLERYPTLAAMLPPSKRITPWVDRPRLQRWSPATRGDRHLVMPTAAATIDPLHSTGIAHGLAGVARIASIILRDRANTKERETCVDHYAALVSSEVRWIDHLVATAYTVMSDFRRFSLATQCFLLAAITAEERLTRHGNTVHEEGLFGLNDPELVETITDACQWLTDRAVGIDDIESRIWAELSPWNRYGLFDPAAEGRYAYTATKKLTEPLRESEEA